MARPTKLTPETQAKIIEAMQVGNYFHVCCEYAGVSQRVGYNWIERAKDALAQAEEHNTPIPTSEQPYVQFLQAVTQARAQAEIRLVSSVARAALQDKEWRAAVEILKRGFRENWRDEATIKHTGRVKVDVDESLAHLEEVARLMLDAGE